MRGANAIVIPIHGPEQLLVAPLCVLGFASHFDDEAVQKAGQQLKAEAESISRSLGAR
jgi:DNA-binding IclR family transcriptional regulator